MTFTVKIALQPFEVSFEAGSIGEAVAILQEPGNELSKLAALATGATDSAGEETETAATTETDKPKRGRRPKNQPDPATAVAPPPVPVPTAPAPAPAPTPTGEVATIAPPPVPAPAAPAPAAPPPVGVLAAKVVAELKRRGEGAADNGAALVAWLASAGLVVPGATFQEAIDCVSFLDDAKLGPVATGLGVTA
jgi:hypothetical protein